MENKELKVEEIKEPKIESRFGYGKTTQIFSSQATKIVIGIAAVLLVTLFILKSPDSVDSNGVTIKTPDMSEVDSNQSLENLENYSVTVENERLKKNKVSSKTKIVQKLSGLQRIERSTLKQIPPASFVKAKLVTTASDGLVKAVLIEPLKNQGELLLQAGSILVGIGQSSENSLTIRFNNVIYRDGTFEGISAQAADFESQTIGLKGSRLSRYAVKYAASVGLNFLSGVSQGLQEKEVMGQHVVNKSNMKNALLNGASASAIEMANDSMNEYKGKLPPIQVPKDTEFWVVFDGGK
jgi:hypothetical protein